MASVTSPPNGEAERGPDAERAAASEGSSTSRRRVLQTGAVSLTAGATAGCIAGEFPPDGVGGGTDDGPTIENPSNAKEDLQWWASIKEGDGEAGRPLPVTGSWNYGDFSNQPWDSETAEAWSAQYFTELIEEGHHVLPTFRDPVGADPKSDKSPSDLNTTVQFAKYGKGELLLRKPLEYCAEHNLPIAFRDWNLLSNVATFEDRQGLDTSIEETAKFVQDGTKTGKASPIGPVERWRAYGRHITSNDWMRAIQEVYPDPPMVVFLDNNEAGGIHPAKDLTRSKKTPTRVVDRFGSDWEDNLGEIMDGYTKRRRALYDAGREAAPEGWTDAIRFVPYNNIPGGGRFNRGAGLQRNPLGTEDIAALANERDSWKPFDGGMPEYYLNDWQIRSGKTDYRAWSPQTETTSYVPMSRAIFDQQPEFYFASIGWEGGPPSHVGTSPYVLNIGRLGTGDIRRWDVDRYMGMIQFGLWMMRPRSFREFRGGATRDAYYRETWQRYLDMVDRVWASDRLQEFWKHGDVVDLGGTDWMDGFEHWYLLECDANPPPAEWGEIRGASGEPLRVFSLAIRLGEEPDRRWLVYGHAPLGAVADATVTIPEYGAVNLPTVSRCGSFYVVEERGDTADVVITGGPATIEVEAGTERVSAGSEIEVTASVTCPPSSEFKEFEWEFGIGGETRQTGSLGSETVTLDEAGQQMVRVTGTTGDGETVSGETTVFVGSEPDDALVYDTPLSAASSWAGEWRAVGEPDEWPGELQRWRVVPNGGAAKNPMLMGGEFVDDGEKGRVVELGAPDFVRGEATPRTSRADTGPTHRTVAVSFKPDSVSGRQTIYSEGGASAGFHVYLDGATVHAGNWARSSDHGNWSGTWLQADGVEAGTWHRVALVLDGASGSVTDDALHLYLDGDRVASGAAKQIQSSWGPPASWGRSGRWYHDSSEQADRDPSRAFVGRLADLEYRNDASPP